MFRQKHAKLEPRRMTTMIDATVYASGSTVVVAVTESVATESLSVNATS
jgi:hypothetical protein